MELIFIIVGFIAAFVALCIWGYHSREAVLGRLLKNTKTVPIASVEEGSFVKIFGTIEFDDPFFISPITGRKCVGYRIVVEKRSVRNFRWQAVAFESKSKAFFLRDDSGLAYVNAIKGELHLKLEIVHRSNFLIEANGNLKKFLSRNKMSTSNSIGIPLDLRYREAIIEPGMKLGVFGYGSWVQSEFPEHLNSAQKLLHIEKGKESIYIVTGR